MKRAAIAGGAAALVLGAALAWSQAPPPDDEMKAMRDEIERSRKMSVSNLEKPYFIQYLVDEAENFSVSASLGGLMTRRHEKYREPEVRIRVGDYAFDNSNYTGSSFNFGTRYDLGRFPLEDSYSVLRRFLWLETDSAYKSAVEALSRKRAALRNLNQSDQLADFARAQPVERITPISASSTIDEEAWTRRVRDSFGAVRRVPGGEELEHRAGVERRRISRWSIPKAPRSASRRT